MILIPIGFYVELDKTLDSTHLSIHVSSLGFCYHMVLCLVHLPPQGNIQIS